MNNMRCIQPVKAANHSTAFSITKAAPFQFSSAPSSDTLSRYEIPRKLVHLLVGSIILRLHTLGISPARIAIWNLQALLFFTGVDVLRHHSPTFNAGHHAIFGCLMRQKESARYNSLIWYLLGTYLALVIFPTDVGLMGVLILCYSDTAASLFGRLFAGYTICLRRGKSLAGTLAAVIVGAITGMVFWGDSTSLPSSFHPEASCMFAGSLSAYPCFVRGYPTGNFRSTGEVISGRWAIYLLGLVSGLVAGGSEFVDVLGCDDNLVMPVLSSLGLCVFLWIFGDAAIE